MLDVVAGLQKLGFSFNEARVYQALLSHPLSTGYEIGKHSGVPRAKVYEVLENLVNSGAVVGANEGGRQVYRATSPDTLLTRRQEAVEEVISQLRPSLAALEEVSEDPPIMTLRGYENSLRKAREICQGASRNLLVAGFPDELELLAEDLRSAQERGVDVFALLFGKSTLGISQVFEHSMTPLQDQQVERFGRWLALVRDLEESIFSQIRSDGTTSVWTENLGMVLALTMWIQHDIAVHIMMSDLSSDMMREMRAKNRGNPSLVKLWRLTVEEEGAR